MKLLEVELVPQSSHFKNLRSDLKSSEWDLLRKDSYKKAGHRCEICGGKGSKWPVECHEIWDYTNGIQTLLGLIALCPACHESKHMGLAQLKGRMDIAKKHLGKVNDWSSPEVEQHVVAAFQEWSKRSKQKWTLDITWAHDKIKELKC